MNWNRRSNGLSRRDWLKTSFALVGTAALADLASPSLFASQRGAATADPLDQMRQQMGAAPIETVMLGPSLTMLSGPGGNVVVLNGADGRVVIDSFVQTAWPQLKQMLDGMDK